MRFLLFLIFISSVVFAKKNDQLVFKIKIVEYNQGRQATIKLDSAVVSLYVDSVSEANLISRKVQTGKDEPSFSFSLGKNFLLGIGKQGYITKWIFISTQNVPDKRQSEPFSEFSIEIDLFKKYPGIDYAIFDKPIAAITYNASPDIEDFEYDKKYFTRFDEILAVKKMSFEKEMELDKDLKAYQQHIQLADSLYKAKSWSKALESYKAAAELKPGEQYPKERIILCERKSDAERKNDH